MKFTVIKAHVKFALHWLLPDAVNAASEGKYGRQRDVINGKNQDQGQTPGTSSD